MVNGIDKKALFRLKAEPYLKPISDLGVGFYNLDENTAKIEFQLYNSKGTLQISEINIDAYAYFESANGSVSDVIDLEVLDGLNGIVGITLDKEFLQASTDTKVKGQVYVGVNNVDNNPENNEVAVFREFTFEVADALINKISSFTKIEYIRMFDQLKARIL
ncbi:BppU family phage baseplate upper protein, partial [Mammaliicoccus sp. M-M49]|uniref:BppU family phage baseplate upper protein n=1 Tax=Mammaliicoccus sp. M-M49 TaxID=2898708 RepID=UPI001EFBE030